MVDCVEWGHLLNKLLEESALVHMFSFILDLSIPLKVKAISPCPPVSQPTWGSMTSACPCPSPREAGACTPAQHSTAVV